MTRQSEAIHRLLPRVPNRRRVFEAVLAVPGTHARLLSRDLGMAFGVVEHHVRHLEKHGLVYAHRAGRRRTLYAVGHIDPEDARILHVLRKPVWGRLVQAVLDEDLGVAELSQRLGLASSTVSHHLRRLRSDGVLEHLRAGGQAAYIVCDPERVRRLLASLEPPAPAILPSMSDGAWAGLVERARHYAAARTRRDVPDPVLTAFAQD